MNRALKDLKVLDLTMNLPGPYMTWLLAVLGAEVLKVENPRGGDYARALGGGPGEVSPAFAAVNRNKKSLSLNLKTEEGRRIFCELLSEYDVVVEGFRPGVMSRLGLDYASLSAIQPRVIMVSISGYGQDGPYCQRAGHDVNYMALAGLLAMTGTRDGQPVIPGFQTADLAGGSLMAVTGLLAALLQREKTGRGQFVDAAMFDGVFSLATMVFGLVEAGLDKPAPGRMMLNGRLPCYGLYRTADGRYMSLGALEPKFWINFCQSLDREDLVDQQFGDWSVVEQVAGIFALRTQAEWISFFEEHDCCCEPVLDLLEAAASELCRARNLVADSAPGRRQLAPPFRLSESPPAEELPAPGLGQHTLEILRQLGYKDNEIDLLVQQGII